MQLGQGLLFIKMTKIEMYGLVVPMDIHLKFLKPSGYDGLTATSTPIGGVLMECSI